MQFLKRLFQRLTTFLTRRFIIIGRIVIGIFMILMGLWFVLAPITQEFLSKSEQLQETPYLWLIVPVGILQIFIGISLMRPVFKKKS